MIYLWISSLVGLIYPILTVAAMKGRAIVFRGILNIIVWFSFCGSIGIVLHELIRG